MRFIYIEIYGEFIIIDVDGYYNDDLLFINFYF